MMNTTKPQFQTLLRLALITFSALCLSATAAERTLLIGPKTIGRGWKDNILVEARQFANVQSGDLLCLYVSDFKKSAQGAFQDPQDWQGVSPEWGCFNVSGTVRMKVTQAVLDKIQARGMFIGGHDYRIVRLTHIPATEVKETFIYKGPSVRMADDWSRYANLQARIFKNVKVGDGIRFYVSKVQPGAAIKLTDMTYNTINKAVDGAPIGEESFTYYINEQSQLIQLSLASQDGISLRVTGKGYTLNRISVVSITSEEDTDISQAQRAPKEYKLMPGEVFHGEKDFPQDWSGNLRLSAEQFQECSTSHCLVISYEKKGTPAQLSFRENQGRWLDLTGSEEPVWYELDSSHSRSTGSGQARSGQAGSGQVQDIIYPFDDITLDKVKTKGLVITGIGCTVTRVSLLKIE